MKTPAPKCPGCGKALYKTLEKGVKSKKTDKYRYCRYQKCEFYLKDQYKEEKIEIVESEMVTKIREEVKEKFKKDSLRLSYILLLSIVSQELGYKKFAKKIIKKFKLNKMYNIKK